MNQGQPFDGLVSNQHKRLITNLWFGKTALQAREGISQRGTDLFN